MNEHNVEILLVEDNPSDAELTLDALREHNLADDRIQVVRDGAEALEFVFCRGAFAQRANRNPKLILLDLKLPKISGHEVLQRIRADEHTRKTPVVILTSSQEERDITACYDLGVNSYIVKPVDFEQFTAAVQQLGLYWLMLNQPPGS